MNLEQRAERINANWDRMLKTGKTTVDLAIDIGIDLGLAKEEIGHGDFMPWVTDWLNINQQQVQKYIRIGVHKAQVRAIAADSSDVPTINELVAVLPKSGEEPIVTSADADALGYAGVANHNRKTRDSDDWHTPGEYVDDARRVMGSIDLDPFTSPEANEYVGAKHILTQADDALATDWARPDVRNVWMNPPYGRGMMNKAVARLIDQRSSFESAVVLTNAATDTYWYHDLLKSCDAVCQTLGRIAFISGDKELSGNTKGQAFFYFGPNKRKFADVFSKHGWVASTGDYS